MATFAPGDLISYRLQGASFGLARVLNVESSAINDTYHLAIYDAVLDANPGEIDDYVGPVDRLHDFEGFENLRVVCRSHNTFFAVRKFGSRKMAAYLRR